MYPDIHRKVNKLRNLYKLFKNMKSFRREPIAVESSCTKLICKNILFEVLLHCSLNISFIYF